MSSAVEKSEDNLDAKAAIRRGFDLLREFYSDSGRLPINALLEGLEYHENQETWDVTISFDVPRERIPSPFDMMAQRNLFKEPAEQKTEARTITIRASDGGFVKMRSA